jgi:FlgD Ig-like domain
MSPLRILLLAAIIALGVGPAHAVPVPGLFNTGVDDSGALLGAGVTDPHYQLIVSADPNYPGPAAVVANPIAAGYWLANSATSQWIAPAMAQGYPSGGTPHPGGIYTYRLSFDLTGFDLATVQVSWGCAMDNNGTIKLNGVLLGTGVGGYNPLTAYSITSGFVAGLNHLDFQANNFAAGGVNPTGVRVQGLSGSGTMSTSPVPPSAAGARALLLPCRPNPFNPRTTIRFELPEAGTVQLAVFDLAGRLVTVLVEADLDQGAHDAAWDGRDASGRKVGSGSYLARLRFGGKVETVRMALVQ